MNQRQQILDLDHQVLVVAVQPNVHADPLRWRHGLDDCAFASVVSELRLEIDDHRPCLPRHLHTLCAGFCGLELSTSTTQKQTLDFF